MFDWAANITSHPHFSDFVLWVSMTVVGIGFLQNLIYAWCIPHAWIELNKHSQRDDDHAGWEILRSKSALPISIIVPAYNEANTIRENVMALMALQYPDLRIIVVNDGSSDNTASIMIEEFEMVETYLVRDTETISHKPIRQIYRSLIYPSLLFIDKENGKKADAINVGLTCVRTPLFCVIDADSLLEPDALLKVVRPFMETSDNVIAVGGTVGIVNGCTVKNGQVVEYKLPKSFLARLQVVEYIRAFLMARLAASRKGSLAIISGAFGVFRPETPYSVRYVPEPVCWTEAPETMKFLSNQRTRWQRGALECLSRHKKMIFNPRYGRLGMITLPTFVLVDVISPIAEIIGYCLMILFVLLGWLNVKFFIAITVLIFSFGVLVSILSLLLEQDEIERFSRPKDIWNVLVTAVTENFGFRQICSIWRIRGLIQHFRGMKPTWGSMERKGFSVSTEK